jgi:histidine triad (HIT) family protein
MTPYDDQNLFARILRGEIPCHRVYENQRTLAFLDPARKMQKSLKITPHG